MSHLHKNDQMLAVGFKSIFCHDDHHTAPSIPTQSSHNGIDHSISDGSGQSEAAISSLPPSAATMLESNIVEPQSILLQLSDNWKISDY